MLKAPTMNSKLAKLRAGFLIKDIIQRASGKSNSNHSMYLYAGHESTIVDVMNTLRIFNVSIYCCCKIVV